MFFSLFPYAVLLMVGDLCEGHGCSPSKRAAVPGVVGSAAASAGRISCPVIPIPCSLLLKRRTVQDSR